MSNEMNILGKKGDVRVTWNPDKKDEVKVAENTFKAMIKKKYKAFLVSKNGKKGKQITEFDKNAERILFLPEVGGGDETLKYER